MRSMKPPNIKAMENGKSVGTDGIPAELAHTEMH